METKETARREGLHPHHSKTSVIERMNLDYGDEPDISKEKVGKDETENGNDLDDDVEDEGEDVSDGDDKEGEEEQE